MPNPIAINQELEDKINSGLGKLKLMERSKLVKEVAEYDPSGIALLKLYANTSDRQKYFDLFKEYKNLIFKATIDESRLHAQQAFLMAINGFRPEQSDDFYRKSPLVELIGTPSLEREKIKEVLSALTDKRWERKFNRSQKGCISALNYSYLIEDLNITDSLKLTLKTILETSVFKPESSPLIPSKFKHLKAALRKILSDSKKHHHNDEVLMASNTSKVWIALQTSCDKTKLFKMLFDIYDAMSNAPIENAPIENAPIESEKGEEDEEVEKDKKGTITEILKQGKPPKEFKGQLFDKSGLSKDFEKWFNNLTQTQQMPILQDFVGIIEEESQVIRSNKNKARTVTTGSGSNSFRTTSNSSSEVSEEIPPPPPPLEEDEDEEVPPPPPPLKEEEEEEVPSPPPLEEDVIVSRPLPRPPAQTKNDKELFNELEKSAKKFLSPSERMPLMMENMDGRTALSETLKFYLENLDFKALRKAIQSLGKTLEPEANIEDRLRVLESLKSNTSSTSFPNARTMRKHLGDLLSCLKLANAKKSRPAKLNEKFALIRRIKEIGHLSVGDKALLIKIITHTSDTHIGSGDLTILGKKLERLENKSSVEDSKETLDEIFDYYLNLVGKLNWDTVLEKVKALKLKTIENHNLAFAKSLVVIASKTPNQLSKRTRCQILSNFISLSKATSEERVKRILSRFFSSDLLKNVRSLKEGVEIKGLVETFFVTGIVEAVATNLEKIIPSNSEKIDECNYDTYEIADGLREMIEFAQIHDDYFENDIIIEMLKNYKKLSSCKADKEAMDLIAKIETSFWHSGVASDHVDYLKGKILSTPNLDYETKINVGQIAETIKGITKIDTAILLQPELKTSVNSIINLAFMFEALQKFSEIAYIGNSVKITEAIFELHTHINEQSSISTLFKKIPGLNPPPIPPSRPRSPISEEKMSGPEFHPDLDIVESINRCPPPKKGWSPPPSR